VSYGPYGKPQGTPPVSKAYINERYDAETGLQYLHFRYYDPLLGRFLSPDSWDPILKAVDINRYAYAGNDPINSNDATGHLWDDHADSPINGSWGGHEGTMLSEHSPVDNGRVGCSGECVKVAMSGSPTLPYDPVKARLQSLVDTAVRKFDAMGDLGFS